MTRRGKHDSDGPEAAGEAAKEGEAPAKPGEETAARRPEWAPEGGEGFASSVLAGVSGGHDGLPGQKSGGLHTARRAPAKRRELKLDDYERGILGGDRTILGRAITLIESNAAQHRELAQALLLRLLPRAGRSVRVGITGVPGVGKSTFIEALGLDLIARGHRVVVLAVDPSSSVTRGSILGDKTRMAELAKCEEAFIRPSPTGGDLGGVTRKSRETIVLCEAFGSDSQQGAARAIPVVLVETVGVGQSETTVRSMVDFFLLLMLAGAGDELQGIKKGVIELADALVINKADGDNERPARLARNEYSRALRYLAPATRGWQTRAHTCSALTNVGIDEVWRVVERFIELTRDEGVFEQRRQEQIVEWMHAMVEQHLRDTFYRDAAIAQRLPSLEEAVRRGERTAAVAATELLELFYARLRTKAGSVGEER